MLQTYEATLEPGGQVWFTDFSKPVVQTPQKVLVTIVSPWIDKTLASGAKSPATSEQVKAQVSDWNRFSGALKNTAAFAGDTLSIQQQLRSEWR